MFFCLIDILNSKFNKFPSDAKKVILSSSCNYNHKICIRLLHILFVSIKTRTQFYVQTLNHKPVDRSSRTYMVCPLNELTIKIPLTCNQSPKHIINIWNKGFATSNYFSDSEDGISRRNKPIHAFINKSQEIIYE